MQKRTIFILLVTLAMPSASFWFCTPEKNKPKKEVKKATEATSLKTKSHFSAYTQAGPRGIFAKPLPKTLTMIAIPEIHPKGYTLTLAAKNEITSVDRTDSYKKPFESIPNTLPSVSVPVSLSTVERIDKSPEKDTDNILNPSSNSVPIETKPRSPVPVVPLTSHIFYPPLNEENENDGLSAGKSNLTPVKQMTKPQENTKLEINSDEGPEIPMPPAPPKLPTFSKAGISVIQNDGPLKSNPPAKSPPVAPPMPTKMATYKRPSMGHSHAALTVGRGGLRQVQTQNSNLKKPTQLDEKPQLSESERQPCPIKAADLMVCKKTLRPVSQMPTSPMPQTIQNSYKQMQRTPAAKPKAINYDEGSGVSNPARRFDNPIKTPSNPMLSELAMVSERRQHVNNIDWDKFDRIIRN